MQNSLQQAISPKGIGDVVETSALKRPRRTFDTGFAEGYDTGVQACIEALEMDGEGRDYIRDVFVMGGVVDEDHPCFDGWDDEDDEQGEAM